VRWATETFAFDPAGNIQVPDTAQQGPISQRAPLPKLLDNLLKEYAGVSYRYDERGNLVERMQHGKRSEYAWDAFNRMTRAVTSQGVTTFAYDPLGRRIAKHSQALDGGALREPTRTMYGWDGDTLALESSVYGGHTAGERTVHYVYERNSFVPLVQATRSQAVRLAATTDVKAMMVGNYGKYDVELDPLWNGEYEQKLEPFSKDETAFYQCDHLGTPQELTDCEGKVAWSAQYKAWGEAKEAISAAARKAGTRNPIRFQGQYFDDETRLHYNLHRYYDPHVGRFILRDTIGLLGGLNFHQYAPNPTGWIDPLGLIRCPSNPSKVDKDHNGRWRDSQGRFAKDPGWPANFGFAPGKDSTVTLSPGDRIDRFGKPTGGFLSPAGTAFGARALPASTYNAGYHVYEVQKPINGVRAGPAEPWFNQPGNGTQYQLPLSVQSHLNAGELVEILNSCSPPRK